MTAPAPLHPNLTLYDATAELNAAFELLAETEGELTPEVEALLTEAGANFDAKAERVALRVNERLALAAAVGAEADRLTKRQAALEREAKALKQYLLRELSAAGRAAVEGTLATIRVQSSSPAVRAALTEAELRELAASRPALVRVVPETVALDSRAVLAAAKAGEPLPAGVTVERGTYVRIY